MRDSSAITNIWAFVALLLLSCLGSAYEISPDWENVKYDRVVDLTKSYVKERHVIQAKNIAPGPVSEYFFAVPTSLSDDISLFVPILSVPNADQPLLAAELIAEEFSDPNFSFYKIQLPFPIAPKSNIQVTVSYVYTNHIKPVPEKNPMGTEQTLLLEAPKLPLSSYDTLEYALRFIGLESFNELPLKLQNGEDVPEFEGSIQDDALTYGPYKKTFKAYTNLPIALLYARQIPLPYVYHLSRQFWVSHWSNALQLEEKIDLSNKGVELDSGFSRVDWYKGRFQVKKTPVITAIPVPLPAGVETTDVYYTDLVGNVSTSMFYNNELILKPRFPIFGGWHFNFTLGWTNKLSDFARTSNDGTYILKVPILNGIRDTTYEDVDLEFYLPEGAKVIDVQTPFDHHDLKIEHELSYLDMGSGHTKIAINFKNLVDELSALEVLVVYQYTTFDMIKKPLITALYTFLGFMGFFALTKIDLSIKK